MPPIEWKYLVGDVREVLHGLPERSVQCIVTSPPYWSLRDYKIPSSIWGGSPDCEHAWGNEQVANKRDSNRGELEWSTGGDPAAKITGTPPSQGQYCSKCGAWRGCLGLEPTPRLYIEHMVEVCRELWRVLRDDGTFWLNMGDCYASQGGGEVAQTKWQVQGASDTQSSGASRRPPIGLKPKDKIMMPHRLAIALQDDGWYVRQDIVWSKANPMPESITDRPTTSHEYIFLLAKSARYFYDADAVREPHAEKSYQVYTTPFKGDGDQSKGDRFNKWLEEGEGRQLNPMGRNLRSVWNITTQPFPEAHFATFPERIPEICIKAGTSQRGCCPKCGAPWERVVEKVQPPSEMRNRSDETKMSFKPTQVGGGQKLQDWYDAHPPQTVGWQPSCECDPDVLAWKRSCGADAEGKYHGTAIKEYEGTGAENPSEVKARILAGMGAKKTVGWAPGCGCDEYEGKQKEGDIDKISGRKLNQTTKILRDAGLPHDNVFIKGNTVGWAPGCECDLKVDTGKDKKTVPSEGYGKRRCTEGEAGQQVHPEGVTHDLDGPPRMTVGWSGACECGSLEPVPCTVLDPFAGSGTTLMVARRLGRAAIGIDISAEYEKMARKRAMLDTPDILSFGDD